MNHRWALVAVFLCLLVSGCGQSDSVIGTWAGGGVTLTFSPGGKVIYAPTPLRKVEGTYHYSDADTIEFRFTINELRESSPGNWTGGKTRKKRVVKVSADKKTLTFGEDTLRRVEM